MKKKTYTRTLKLGPAIGDWTKIHFQDPSLSEVQITEVKDINFDSLPKDDMKDLHLLHYRLAEKLALSIASDLDIKVELHTISASQMTYKEFMESQTEQIVQADYLISSLGRVNVLFDWALADMIVNRLTGGKGDSHEGYHFSDIESAILESQMDSLKKEFVDIWDGAFTETQLDMAFSYGSYVYDKKFSLREAYIVFTFNLYFGKGDLTKVSWAYPNNVLRHLLATYRKKSTSLKQRVLLNKKTLAGINVPIRAELGKATLKMCDLKSLQVGDIIPLDTLFNKPLEFRLGKTVTLMSQPGVFNDRIGLQLLLAEDGAVGSFSIKRNLTDAFPISVQPDKAEKSAQIVPLALKEVTSPKVVVSPNLDEERAASTVLMSKDPVASPSIDNHEVFDDDDLDLSMDEFEESEHVLDTPDSEDKPALDLNNLTMEANRPSEEDVFEETMLVDDVSQNDELEEINLENFSENTDKNKVVEAEVDTELDFDDDFSWDDLDEDL